MTLAIFHERATEIKITMLILQVALGLFLPFGVSLAGRVRLMEHGRTPTLTYLHLGAVIVVTTQLVLMSVIWALAAFRTDETSPQIVQLLNDAGWFLFLFCFVPMTMWVASMAWAILQDTSDHPTYPRWVGYLSAWVAMLLVPGGILVFFKEGIFAWNGLLPCYIPFAGFFLWAGTISFFTIRAIRRELMTRPGSDLDAADCAPSHPRREVRHR